MPDRYYSGLTLEKDRAFCAIVRELESDPRVFIIRTGGRVTVHVMTYNPPPASQHSFFPGRSETGETYEGFDYHYVTFLFRDRVISLNASDYYPFDDDNHPGPFYFVVYRRINRVYCRQDTYPEAWKSLDALDDYIKIHVYPGLSAGRSVPTKPIDWNVQTAEQGKVILALNRMGGVREWEVWKKNPLILPTETWNNGHRVVAVVAPEPDEDGRRDSFEVDTVTGLICG